MIAILRLYTVTSPETLLTPTKISLSGLFCTACGVTLILGLVDGRKAQAKFHSAFRVPPKIWLIIDLCERLSTAFRVLWISDESSSRMASFSVIRPSSSSFLSSFSLTSAGSERWMTSTASRNVERVLFSDSIAVLVAAARAETLSLASPSPRPALASDCWSASSSSSR